METFFHFKSYMILHIRGGYYCNFLWLIQSLKISVGSSDSLLIILMTLNNADPLPHKLALLYPWRDNLWDRNAIRSPIHRFSLLAPLLWMSYPTTFVWFKVSLSCFTAALSSPKVKTRKIQEARKDQRKTWTQRTRTCLTKGPLITRGPFLIQVRRNNKSSLSVNLIWSGEEWMQSLKKLNKAE